MIGGSYRNPFDMANTIGRSGDADNLRRIMDILAEDPNIDGMVYEFTANFFARFWKEEPGLFDEMMQTWTPSARAPACRW